VRINACKTLQVRLYQICEVAVKVNPQINGACAESISTGPESDAKVLYWRLARALRHGKTNDLHVVDRPPPIVSGVEHAERDDHFSSPRGIVQIYGNCFIGGIRF